MDAVFAPESTGGKELPVGPSVVGCDDLHIFHELGRPLELETLWASCCEPKDCGTDAGETKVSYLNR